jgi:predicted Rossmann-fold nucleotide-binding protein
LRTFIAETLLVEKTIEAEDAELFYVTDSSEEAVSIIKATDQETEPA